MRAIVVSAGLVTPDRDAPAPVPVKVAQPWTQRFWR